MVSLSVSVDLLAGSADSVCSISITASDVCRAPNVSVVVGSLLGSVIMSPEVLAREALIKVKIKIGVKVA